MITSVVRRRSTVNNSNWPIKWTVPGRLNSTMWPQLSTIRPEYRVAVLARSRRATRQTWSAFELVGAESSQLDEIQTGSRSSREIQNGPTLLEVRWNGRVIVQNQPEAIDSPQTRRPTQPQVGNVTASQLQLAELGGTFAFRRKRFVGSYLPLSLTSRG